MTQLPNSWSRFHLFWRVKSLATRTKPRIEQILAPHLRQAKKRAPYITANIITTSRAFPGWLAYALFTAQAPWPRAAAAVYLVTALLDWLDGAWARANSEDSGKFGKVFDPLVDKLIVLSWLLFFTVQGVFSWNMLWTMAGLEVLSTLIYFVRLDRLQGANWFGGAKKVLQDICVLLAILGLAQTAVWTLGAAIALSVASSWAKAVQPHVSARQTAQQNALG